MNRKVVGFRFTEETNKQIGVLQAERGENKTQAVVASIRRLYLVYLKRKQKGKTEELTVIQKEIEVIESVMVERQIVVKKVKDNIIKTVNCL